MKKREKKGDILYQPEKSGQWNFEQLTLFKAINNNNKNHLKAIMNNIPSQSIHIIFKLRM